MCWVVERDLSQLSLFCSSNKISINLLKCNVMLFNPQKVAGIDIKIMLNDFQLTIVEKTTFLGFKINNTLCWDDHIQHVCNKLTTCLYILLRCNSFLPTDKLKLIFNSIGLNHVGYGCQFYSCTSEKSLHPLKMKYHECARAILGVKRVDHISNLSILKQLNLLNLNAYFKLQKLLFIYKSVNKLLPSYCSDIFIQQSTSTVTRSNNVNFFLPRVLTKFGENSFSYWGPKLWLDIDNSIKSLPLKSFHSMISAILDN